MLKVCFTLLLASLSISLTFALDICEHQANGVRLAHPADCNKFVICRNGQTAVIKTCPIGLHFNRFKGVCDLKERAACDIEFVQLADSEVDCTACCAVCGCDGSTLSTPETPVTDETPCPGTPTPGTPATPSPKTPGTPATPSPETPAIPSPETPATSSPETSGTPNTPSPETPATPPPETSGTPATPSPETPVTHCGNNITVCVNKPDGSVSHVNGICNQYIVCSGGCAHTMNCPNNLQYNLNTNNCDYPENVDCPWESKPPITGPSGVACAQPGECAGKKDGTMLADPESNGDGYIVCQCECEIKMPCPSDTKFDVELQVCANPNNTGNSSSNGNGHTGNNNGNGNSTNAVTCVTDVCKEGDELLPVDGECNKFYQCDNNCAIEIICPNNLIYNPANKQCDFPQNYNCPWPYTPPSGPSEGPSGIACVSGGRCTGKPEGALLPSLVSDSKFVVCQCQCEVERDCPSGLVWDNQKSTCNWPNTLIN